MQSALQDDHSVRTGVLLVGHGTRSELGRKQCQALANDFAARLEPRQYATELAYLELASPTIEEAIACLLAKKIQQMVVAPLLLFAAGHAKEDIPSAVRAALAAAGQRELLFFQTPPLGLQPPVIELAVQRFHDVADPQIAKQDTCLLLIGRGSRDEEATAEMRQLGSLLHEHLGIGQTTVGFLAMAQPPAQEIITTAATSHFQQVVVQPHLLFHGELLDRLRFGVSAAAEKSPHQTWCLSRVLGEDAGGSDSLDSPNFSSLARILRQAIESAGNK